MSKKMTPSERRQAEKVALRESILEAARTLFARCGYEATTMRAIAEAISYAPAAVYYHFEDKQDLVRELSNRDFRALMNHFAEFAKVEDPMHRLFLIGQAYMEFALRHPEQYRFMFMTPKPKDYIPKPGDIERGNPGQDAYAFLVQTAAQALAQGRIREGLTDPHTVAQIAWSAMHGVAGIHLVMTCDPNIPWTPVRELAMQAGLTVLQGVAAKPRRESERVQEVFTELIAGRKDLDACCHQIHDQALETEATAPLPAEQMPGSVTPAKSQPSRKRRP